MTFPSLPHKNSNYVRERMRAHQRSLSSKGSNGATGRRKTKGIIYHLDVVSTLRSWYEAVNWNFAARLLTRCKRFQTLPMILRELRHWEERLMQLKLLHSGLFTSVSFLFGFHFSTGANSPHRVSDTHAGTRVLCCAGAVGFLPSTCETHNIQLSTPKATTLSYSSF